MEDLGFLALALLGYYGCYRAGHWLIDRATSEAWLRLQLGLLMLAALLQLGLGVAAFSHLLRSL
jgi:hypothetical protein